MNEVIVASAVRTAIGDFGGALGRAALRPGRHRHQGRAGARGGQGRRSRPCGRGPRHQYRAARHVSVARGRHQRRHRQETPAFNVNRLCGSGLQAIVSAAQTIMLGDAEIAVGAGAESMSRAPYIAPAQRWARAWATASCWT